MAEGLKSIHVLSDELQYLDIRPAPASSTLVMESDSSPALPIIKIDSRGDLTLRVGADRTDESKPQPKCLLVCSRTMARVSPVFDRMIYGSFAEARPADGKEWTVDLPEDKPSALELFATISHGFLHRVPRALSIHELFDLTVLTHYYDATRILVPWVRPWMDVLHDPAAATDDAAPKMLWISWELGHRQMFEATVRRITMEGSGSMFAEGSALQQLQMPSDVIERICAVRDDAVDSLLGVMRSFIELLTVVDERPRWCRHATFMGPHRLWPMPDDTTEVDCSILGLYETLSNLVIHDIGHSARGESDHTACNPREYLMDQLKEILAKMQSPLNESDRTQLMAQAKRLNMA